MNQRIFGHPSCKFKQMRSWHHAIHLVVEKWPRNTAESSCNSTQSKGPKHVVSTAGGGAGGVGSPAMAA